MESLFSFFGLSSVSLSVALLLKTKGSFDSFVIGRALAALKYRRRTPQGQVWRILILRQQMPHLQAKGKLQQSFT